jgi:hypothetical protein
MNLLAIALKLLTISRIVMNRLQSLLPLYLLELFELKLTIQLRSIDKL